MVGFYVVCGLILIGLTLLGIWSVGRISKRSKEIDEMLKERKKNKERDYED